MDAAEIAVVAPLFGAALLTGLKPLRPRHVDDALSIMLAAAVLGLCVVALGRSGDATLVSWAGDWPPREGVAIGISLVADPFAAGIAAFAAALMLAALVMGLNYIDDPTDDLFHVLMLVFLSGMVGFAFAGDLFTLFVFFELTTISAIVLAGYQIEQRAPLEGSLNFAVTNAIATFMLLIGIALVYGRTGALNLAQIGTALSSRPPDALVGVAFALIAAGLLTKAAIVPFHFWLADAYAVARTPVCILFAGVMSELGLYGLARVWWTAFDGALGPSDEVVRAILVVAGGLTAIVGAVMALVQTHLKRLLAFVTVSYLGLFLIGAGLLEPAALAGAALFVLGDGLLKGALFVGVGVLQRRTGHVDEGALHGSGSQLRLTGAMFALAALGVASLPPFGSFIGKALIEHQAGQIGYGWVVAVFVLVPALCGAALLRTAARVFLGLGRPARAGPGDEPDEQTGEERRRGRAPALMRVLMAALLAGSLTVGLWPGLADSTLAAAERFCDPAGYASTVLSGTPATRVAGVDAPPPDLGAWLLATLSVAGALLLALPLARRPDLSAALPEGARRPLTGLRALHSGHPGDYAAMSVLGAGLLAVICAVALR